MAGGTCLQAAQACKLRHRLPAACLTRSATCKCVDLSDKQLLAGLDRLGCVCLLQDLFTGLQAFVRVNMPTGVKWNPSGGSIAAARAAAGTAAPAAPAAKAAAPAKPSAAPGGPKGPPPPPPPPANLSELLLKERPGAKPAPVAAAAGGGMQEVLKALSQVGTTAHALYLQRRFPHVHARDGERAHGRPVVPP